MVECVTPKPIIFDRDKFFSDLNNWELIDDDWCGLDYGYRDEYGYNDYGWDGTKECDLNVLYTVGGDTIDVVTEVTHTWGENICPGDYDTPPSWDIVREEVNVSVIKIFRNDVPIDLNTIQDLVNRLEYYIKDSVIDV